MVQFFSLSLCFFHVYMTFCISCNVIAANKNVFMAHKYLQMTSLLSFSHFLRRLPERILRGAFAKLCSNKLLI